MQTEQTATHSPTTRRYAVSDVEVEKQLREFLEWEKKERASSADDRANLRTAIRETREMRKATEKNGEKLGHIAEAQGHLLNQFTLHEQKDETRHLETKNSIAGVVARVTVLEQDREDTSKHNVEDLKSQLAAERSKNTEQRSWLRRNAFLLIAAFVSAVLSGALTAGCAYALPKLFY